MTNNINKNKNQRNYAIEYEPRFYNKYGLSSGTKDLLPLVSVSLIRVNEQRATIFFCITHMWDIGDTGIIIKAVH